MYRLCSVDLDTCRVLHLEINQRVDGRSASPHGIQQKMCRDFLSEFGDSGTLVAPRRDLKEIMVVGRADFVSNSAVKFQQWLREQCVTVKSVDSADTVSLEECLRYSLFVWLESQQYYRCGKALIKGPFLGTDPSTVVRICNIRGALYFNRRNISSHIAGDSSSVPTGVLASSGLFNRDALGLLFTQIFKEISMRLKFQ
ncbi:hypothetical protein COOONC_12013 [Cooperia oncophora]